MQSYFNSVTQHKQNVSFLFKREVEQHYYPYLEPFVAIILKYVALC